MKLSPKLLPLSSPPVPGITYIKPFASKLRDIRHHAQHRLRAPVHRLRLHVAEPHLQVRRKIVTRQLQHCHIPATVQVQRVHYWHRRYQGSEIKLISF